MIALLRRIWLGVRAVMRVIGRTVSMVLLTVVWIVAIFIPWVVSRLIRWDPLWAPTRAGSRWVEREERLDIRGADLWLPDPGSTILIRRRRARLFVSGLAVAAVVGLLGFGLDRGRSDDPAKNGEAWTADRPSGSGGNEAWSDELQASIESQLDSVTFSQFAGVEMPDFSSEYLNYADGRRATWKPPSGPCRAELTVWMFGGSTLFGFGARDDHTIASELAAAAWEDGVRLHVENWAVPGDVAWQENRRLQRALTTTTSRPDLVVFLDGFNDLRAQFYASLVGRGGKGEFVGFLDRDVMVMLEDLKISDDGSDKEFVVEVPTTGPPPVDPSPILEGAVFQYGAANEESRRIADDAGLSSTRFFQPSTMTRAALAAGEPTNFSPVEQRATNEFRDRLDEDVVDLGSVFDDTGSAVFDDIVHLNEAGQRMVAAKMYEQLGPQFEAASAKVGPRSCS